jgi:hypothetical protein
LIELREAVFVVLFMPLTPYERTYSFTDFQAGNPSAPLPGIQVDNELENIEQSLGGAIDAIKDVRRSDGKLKNGVVTIDSLSPQVAAGVGAGALAAAEAAAASASDAEDSEAAAAASASAAATSAVHANDALEDVQLAQEQAEAAGIGAQTARDFAAQWSSAASGVDINDGVNPVGKSAYHWAQVAEASATGALPDGSVKTAKIVDGAVTEAKLAAAVRDKLTKPFSSKAAAQAFTPVVAPDCIQTVGYTTAGDGGGALYRLVGSEPAHAGKFSITLADGVAVVWYELAGARATPQMFGGNLSNWASFISGKHGVLPAGSYALNAELAVGSGTTIEANGATIDMSGAPASASAFRAAGTEGTRYPLTGNAVKGATTAPLSPANLIASGAKAGDWVRMTSNAVLDSGRTNSRIGEQIKVKSVNGGTGVVTFETPLVDTYTTAAGATLSVMNHATGVCFIGDGKIVSNNSNNHKGITFSICDRPFIGGSWSFERIEDRALSFVDCIAPRGNMLDFEDSQSPGTGYGVSCQGTTQDALFKGLTSRDVRHLFTTNNSNTSPGIPRRITVDGFNASQSAPATGGSGGDAIDTHAASEDIHFWNGVIQGSSGQGVNCEGRSGSIVNVFTYDTEGNGVAVHNETDRPGDWHLENVHAYRAKGSHGVSVRTGVAGTAGYENVSVNNVSGTDCAGQGVAIEGTTAQPVGTLIASSIRALRAGSAINGVSLQNINGGNVRGIDSRDNPNANNAIRVRDCKAMVISGISGKLPSGSSGNLLLLNGSAAAALSDLVVNDVVGESPAAVASFGIRADNNCRNVTIGAGRRLAGFTNDVAMGTGTGHLVSSLP